MNPLDLIPPQYKVAAELTVLAVALAAAGACGALVMHWRDNSTLQTQRAAWADERTKALGVAVAQRDAAIHDRDVLAGQLADVDATQSAQLRKDRDESEKLRAAVAAGAVRLRVVGAHCPAAHDVPQAAAGSGVDSGAGPELDADARQRYFALRDALGLADRTLTACQQSLGTLTGQRAIGAAFNAP